ncbi:hypothetical protein [Vibrio phage CKB-S1]|nr:hypothetical protein [Vibrio phage CKB-S1]
MMNSTVYSCRILPSDGLQVIPEGQGLSVRIRFGGGIGHSTPVQLDDQQALRLAKDIVDWAAQRQMAPPCGLDSMFSEEEAAKIRLGIK